MESGFSSFPQASFDELMVKLQQDAANLPRQEAKLAQYVLLNSHSLGLETGKSLAANVGVSEVTVGRLMRRLGCDGMKGLRRLLREHYSIAATTSTNEDEVPGHLQKTHEAEVKALTNVFKQANGPVWKTCVEAISNADRVFVTGFQSVRGIAEDFGRRLALARPAVQFISAHDSMLGEWLSESDTSGSKVCFVMVDVVPYAQEAQKLGRLAKHLGLEVVLVTDEYCHWGRDTADGVIYAPSKTGLFLESTIGLMIALSLLLDAVARADPQNSAQRLVKWKRNAKRIGIF